MLPYAVTGVVVSLVIFGGVAAGAGGWIVPGDDAAALLNPSTPVEVLFRLLAPTGLGWEGRSQWQFVPMLVIGGGVLLLGSAGFTLAQRLRRSR